MDSTKRITTARDIAKEFEQIAPIESGVPGDELGFILGNPDIPVKGIGCMWCAHIESIQYCIENDINMIICHESLWLSGQKSPWYEAPDDSQIFSNRKRREMLETHGITVYRSHSNWDALPVDGIAGSAVTALGIDGLKTVSRKKFFSIQELPEPITVNQLLHSVQIGLVMMDAEFLAIIQKKFNVLRFLLEVLGKTNCTCRKLQWS